VLVMHPEYFGELSVVRVLVNMINQGTIGGIFFIEIDHAILDSIFRPCFDTAIANMSSIRMSKAFCTGAATDWIRKRLLSGHYMLLILIFM